MSKRKTTEKSVELQVNEFLRQKIDAGELSATKLVEITGVSRMHVYRLLKGEYPWRVDALEKALRFFQMGLALVDKD